MGWFWSIPHETWEAISAVGVLATALVTLLLVIVGGWQISATRRQNARWKTLDSCNSYHLDTTLRASLGRLRAAWTEGQMAGNEAAHRVDIVTLLNYLDSLAIGVYQGLYVEKLARDHIEAIVNAHVSEYLTDGMPKKIGIDSQNYRYLLALHARWTAISRPHFRDSSWWKRWG
jgi:hypothetical protein